MLARLAALIVCTFSECASTIRERRTYRGVPNVLGFTCEHCGAWTPAVERTAEEYARVQRLGAVRRPRVKAVQP